jgi:hypothetical protein
MRAKTQIPTRFTRRQAVYMKRPVNSMHTQIVRPDNQKQFVQPVPHAPSFLSSKEVREYVQLHVHTLGEAGSFGLPEKWRGGGWKIRRIPKPRDIQRFLLSVSPKTWHRASHAFIASVFFATLILPLLTLTPAQAATATLLPDTTIATTPTWSQCNGGTCTNARHTYINQDATGSYNGSTFIGTGATGSSEANAAVEFGLTTVSNVASASSITVNIAARSQTNANGGTLDDIDIQLRIGGSLLTAVRRTPAFSTSNWFLYSATFNGSWTQANLDSAQVLVTRVVQGGGSPTNQRDDVRIAALSADVTYVSAVTLDQSSYRWFSNGGTEDPIVESFSVQSGSTAETNGLIVLDAPEGIEQGDLLVYHLSRRGDVTVAPSGFTNIIDLNSSEAGGAHGIRVAWKIADENDVSAASYEFQAYGDNERRHGVAMLRISNYDVSDPIGAYDSLSSRTTPSVTVDEEDSLGLHFIQNVDDPLSIDSPDAALYEEPPSGGLGSPSLAAVSKYESIPSSSTVSASGGSNSFVVSASVIINPSKQTPLSNQNTPANAPAEGTPFRLRATVGANQGELPADTEFKLQYAQRTGLTCSLDFSAETYADVSLDLSNSDSTNYILPSAGESEQEGDPWVNYEDITNNSTSASYTGPSSGPSPWLRGSGYGFNIPSNAVVTGIEVQINRSGSASFAIQDDEVYLTKDSQIAGDNKAATGTWGLTLATQTYGGSSDLWGTTWTPEDINNNGFGVRFRANILQMSQTANVNYIQIRVHYAPDAVPPIFFYDNVNIANGATIASSLDDPDPGSGNAVMQSYVESNTFTNPNAIPAGDYGVWEFSLADQGAPAETGYCFRIVSGSGDLLESYTVVPEITTAPPDFTQADYQWFENNSDEEVVNKFSQRSGHTSLVFDNKMWVIGGYDGEDYLSDVWSSEDGENWILDAEIVPWVGRANHAAVVYENKMWIFGGQVGPSGMGSMTADIWSSDDGVIWNNEGSLPMGLSGHSVTVHNDLLWLTGGIDEFNNYYETTWFAESDLNWSDIGTFYTWESRIDHTTLSYNDQLWLFGGYARILLTLTTFRDIYYMDDFNDWYDRGGLYEDAVRQEQTALVFSSKMWLLGGTDESDTYANDVWSTSDGTNWDSETFSAEWKGRASHSSVVFDGQMWVIGGYDGNDYLNDVWSSEDGAIWIEVSEDVNTGGGTPSSTLGSPLPGPNEPGVLGGSNQTARLRMLINVDTKHAIDSTLKLQYAPRGGLECSTDFSNESYRDVGHDGMVSFYVNPGVSTGDPISADPDDPTSTRTIVHQSYVSSNNFSMINPTDDGEAMLFDFSLQDVSNFGGTYCFRVVFSDGTPIHDYVRVPELSTPPRTRQFMRHGKWFDSGERARPYYWGIATASP